MRSITKLIRIIKRNEFIKGLIIGIILGIVLCPFKKGITINSYNKGNMDCQNAVHNQKKKKKEKE